MTGRRERGAINESPRHIAAKKPSTRLRRRSSVSRHMLVGFGVEIVVVSSLLRYFAGYGWTSGLVAAVTIIVCTRLLISGLSFVVAALWGDGNRRTPLDVVRRCRLVLREMGAVLRLFFFFHPLAPWLDRQPSDSGPDGTIPVLLVHGFFSNAGFWWSIKRRLWRRSINRVYTMTLEPAFGDLDDYGRQLAVRVDEVCAGAAADRVVLVAHSMGGLVCRAYLREFGERRVVRLVTLGSPHGGTCLARLLPWRNVRQMRADDPWLAKLNGHRPRIPFVSVYSDHDNIIIPQSSATLAGADNVHVPGVGHLDMAFATPILELVAAQIVAARK